MKVIKSKLSYAIIILLIAISPAQALIFHVDSVGGDDGEDGLAFANAWETISKANSTLVAGDTVLIHVGIYTDAIRPANSGTSDANRIIYQAAGDGDVLLHGFVDAQPSVGAISLAQRNYITVSGRADGDPVTTQRLKLEPQSNVTALGTVCGGEGNIVENFFAQCTAGNSCSRGFAFCINFHTDNLETKFNIFRNSHIIGHSTVAQASSETEDIVTIQKLSHHNLIENVHLEICKHSAVYSDGTETHSNVIRGSIISNVQHTGLSIHSAGVDLADGARFLIEDNLLSASAETTSPHAGSNGPRNAFQWAAPELIIRKNTITLGGTFTVGGVAATLGGLAGQAGDSFGAFYFARFGRVYHNTIVNNGGYAVGMFDFQNPGAPDPGEHRFINNVVYESDSPTTSSDLVGYRDQVINTNDRWIRNVFGEVSGNSSTHLFGDTEKHVNSNLATMIAGWSNPDDPEFTAQDGFSNIYLADPGFTNFGTKDYTLTASSPMLDIGAPLTKVATADSGSGISLTVEDSRIFFAEASGFPAWMGVQMGTIAVGTSISTAAIVQILSVNDTSNILTLASSISRNDGDSVWLWKDSSGIEMISGSGPDIGRFEFNVPTGGGSAVDDVAQADPGQAITISILDNDLNTPDLISFDPTSARGQALTLDDNGTPADASDDKIDYTAPNPFLGLDFFQYAIETGGGGGGFTGDVFVNNSTGDDGDDGLSSVNAKATIQAGLDVLNTGSDLRVLVIEAGTGTYYPPSLPLTVNTTGTSSGNPIWIVNIPRGSATISGMWEDHAEGNVTGWTVHSGTVWKKLASGAPSRNADPLHAIDHTGAFLVRTSNASNCVNKSQPTDFNTITLPDGCFTREGTELFIRLSDSSDPNSKALKFTSGGDHQIGFGNEPIIQIDVPHVILDGFIIEGSGTSCMSSGSNGNTITVRNIQFKYCVDGIRAKDDLIAEWNDHSFPGLKAVSDEINTLQSPDRYFTYELFKECFNQGGARCWEGSEGSIVNSFQNDPCENAVINHNFAHETFEALRFGTCKDSVAHHNVIVDTYDNHMEFEHWDNTSQSGTLEFHHNLITGFSGNALSAQEDGDTIGGPLNFHHNVVSQIISTGGNNLPVFKTLMPNTTQGFDIFNNLLYLGNNRCWFRDDSCCDGGLDHIEAKNNILVITPGAGGCDLNDAGGPGSVDSDFNALVRSTDESSLRGGNGFYVGTSTSSINFVDETGEDWGITAGSSVIDQGTVIPGITDGFVGAAPDIGPFEFGETPGTNWPRPQSLTFTTDLPSRWVGLDPFGGGAPMASGTATVVINSSHVAPVAVPDSAQLPVGDTFTLDVLLNDTDVDTPQASLQLLTFDARSDKGQLIERQDPGTPADLTDDNLRYNPSISFKGPDTFTYVVSDGEYSVTGTVTITVTGSPTTSSFSLGSSGVIIK